MRSVDVQGASNISNDVVWTVNANTETSNIYLSRATVMFNSRELTLISAVFVFI